MPLDDQLIRQQTKSTDDPGSSAERSGSMRQEQRGETEGGERVTSLRSARISAMRKKRAKLKNGKKAVLKGLSIPASSILKGALSPQWMLFTFGISALYSYIHLFLRQVFGKDFFVPLGEEWRDTLGISAEKRKRLSLWLRMIEPMGVGCLTIVLLIAIIISFTIPALIIEVVTNPLRSGVALLKLIWSWLKGS